MKKLVLITFVLISISSNTQNSDVEILRIGFSTSFSGNPTKFVSYVEGLVINKNYEDIKKLTQSKSSSK